MKIRTVIGLAGASAASLVGMAGLAAVPVGAAPAQAMDASNLSTLLGLPGIPIFAPFVIPGTPGAFPNDKVTGNCETAAPWLFTDPFALNFVSGNAVVYQPNGGSAVPGVPPSFPGGLNAVGTAQLIDFNTGDTGFIGSAHVWLGQNGNTNGQYEAGETVTFTGTATNGSTISFTVNPGVDHSPSGHMGGWGQQTLSCNILPSS